MHRKFLEKNEVLQKGQFFFKYFFKKRRVKKLKILCIVNRKNSMHRNLKKYFLEFSLFPKF